MLTELLCFDVDPGLYLEKTLDDLGFIDHVLNSLLAYLTENRIFLDREDELDKLIDLEFRFDTLLTGIEKRFPLIEQQITQYKNLCSKRRKSIDETRSETGQSTSEPVVSSQELNELLREL